MAPHTHTHTHSPNQNFYYNIEHFKPIIIIKPAPNRSAQRNPKFYRISNYIQRIKILPLPPSSSAYTHSHTLRTYLQFHYRAESTKMTIPLPLHTNTNFHCGSRNPEPVMNLLIPSSVPIQLGTFPTHKRNIFLYARSVLHFRLTSIFPSFTNYEAKRSNEFLLHFLLAISFSSILMDLTSFENPRIFALKGSSFIIIFFKKNR